MIQKERGFLVPMDGQRHWPLAMIDAPGAWSKTLGSPYVSVGVIDTGIFPHRDLAGALNPGWDFVNDKPDGKDSWGHGTYVAGVLGACHRADALAGMCPGSRLVPLQVTDDRGRYQDDAVVKAVRYAAGMGISVLNYCNGSDEYNPALEQAIRDYPGLFICSAGNTGQDLDARPRFPASLGLPNLLCVAACDRQDRLWQGSNFGKQTVHLAAPGAGVYTTAPGHHPDNAYRYAGGTSVAAPFVTGVAALVLSIVPGADAAFVKEAILAGIDRREYLSGKVLTGGRLNAGKTLIWAIKRHGKYARSI